MNEITSLEQYNDFIQKPKVLIFFGSQFCGHCQDIKPFVYQLASKYGNIKFGHVEVTKVHVDNLEGVPVFYGFHSGEAVDKVEGADKNALTDLLNNL